MATPDYTDPAVITAIIGILSTTIGIIYFMVRAGVRAMNSKDKVIEEQHKELKEIAVKAIETQVKLNDTIIANTKSTDNVSRLMMKVIKNTR